ncbi:MAG: hypothetical protein KAQ94_06010 [Arcobacteraceae bacterium]|nr:hypothetical protein [Arcobacteraceae bacterium]
MWEWLKKADNLKTVGTIVGGVAQGYGTYKNVQALKKQADISQRFLDIQKADYNRGIAKEDLAQSNLDSAFNSSFGVKKKEEPLVALGE